ncbi:hypothetical protein [Pseudalkalibacillus sp. SCS-8]|uniref:hypothetical protein n=1 Tax=Pseudalkalibacillus nanhaiensis TaxID=3115291 RepID=UPI0032DBA8DC
MRIILYELRKLLNWKLIGFLVLLSFLFYHMFLSTGFEYFPNGRPSGDHFKVSKQMIAEYGPEMDKKEFEDFKVTYQEEVEKAGEYLKSHEGFSEAGIATYEEFRSFDRSSNPEVNELLGKVMFEEGVDIFWELQAREGIIDFYAHNDERIFISDNIQDEEWKKEYVKNPSRHAILPNFVVENFSNLITMVAILIVLSVMIIVGRVHIIDRKNNAITLQYTTKEGRNLFKKKMAASMVMATIITTVYLFVFFLMYAQNETSEFFASSLYAFETNYFWIDMTFLQYIIISVIGVYLLSLVAAAIATLISRIAVNYISLIGAHIPIAVLLILLMTQYLITRIFSHQYPVLLTISTYVALLVLAGSILFFRWKKEQKVDIV